MSRTNSQAKIISEEQLVPRANRLVIKKNNQRVASDSHITDTMLRFVVEILRYHKLYNLTLGYDEDLETKLIVVSKMVATRLHQPWRALLSVLNRCLTGKDSSWDTVRLLILQILWVNIEHIVKVSEKARIMEHKQRVQESLLILTTYTAYHSRSIRRIQDFDELKDHCLSLKNTSITLNKSIPRTSDFKLYSSQDDHPITKLLNTTNGDYKFGMEVLDAMISDAIKKKERYKYYMAKRVESKKAKIVDEPEEQHVSPIKSGRGKGFMCYGDQVVNVPNKLKKDVVPRKTRSLTIAKEVVVGEGLSVASNKYYSSSNIDSDATLYSSHSDKPEGSANETDDVDEFDMDLSNDNPDGDYDDARYGVFMHNKSTATPNSSYLSPTVTSSSLDFIQTLLDETPANELTDFMSHPFYTDAHTTSVVHNPEGNPELTSYISGASEVTLSTHVDVLATKTLMHEMFPDKNAHHTPSLPAKKIPYPTTTPQPNSLQAKSKKLMQKAKKNIRKFNFKKAVTQKFKEYDQKLEALTNFNVSKAFEKVVQAKVLTEIKKLLPTHIPNAIANYVKPRLNTFVLEVMKTNQINLFTQSSTSTDDLSEIDLKLKLWNRIHLNKSNDTHITHQQLYDTHYESIILDQDALDGQAA
ncbi:hypothetical protein Tco_1011007 [Tanacetum coccineum]